MKQAVSTWYKPEILHGKTKLSIGVTQKPASNLIVTPEIIALPKKLQSSALNLANSSSQNKLSSSKQFIKIPLLNDGQLLQLNDISVESKISYKDKHVNKTLEYTLSSTDESDSKHNFASSESKPPETDLFEIATFGLKNVKNQITEARNSTISLAKTNIVNNVSNDLRSTVSNVSNDIQLDNNIIKKKIVLKRNFPISPIVLNSKRHKKMSACDAKLVTSAIDTVCSKVSLTTEHQETSPISLR